MSQFTNIVYSCNSVSENFKACSNLLTLPIPVFRIETCYMSIFDAAEPVHGTPTAIFMASARLHPVKMTAKRQQLKLTSNLVNTYIIDLQADLKPEVATPSSALKLTGRGTSDNRMEARKYLLAGLANATYEGSIEEARTEVLNKFSLITLKMLFESYPELIEINKIPTQAWFSSLLGKQ
ncbi:MAG: hypothetical protein JHC33_07190 [Ignisphaera sp.]|nr:hypothetical protein [Ignisphaera sp.]